MVSLVCHRDYLSKCKVALFAKEVRPDKVKGDGGLKNKAEANDSRR